eukprot:m.812051 g.812051  ORF g.812051 m.812051 type:complete len:131 (-) comp23390_c0_seq39:1804-2196(-)
MVCCPRARPSSTGNGEKRPVGGNVSGRVCMCVSVHVCQGVQGQSAPQVVLVGMGADEQFAGYGRHRTRFQKQGWQGLVDEVRLQTLVYPRFFTCGAMLSRISYRNLGRDDRCISDHGLESRYPFLDEDLV